MHAAHRRGWLKTNNSLWRAAKIWPVTWLAWSEARKTASGAFFSGPIAWSLATRAFCSGVSAGIELVIRLQAKGAMQFERTPKRPMSRAIDFDRAATPSLAAE